MPDGNRYESSLERDLMELARNEPDFGAYHAQPVRIGYAGVSGEPESYTPDGLIFWKSHRRPLLVEVKYRHDCHGQWRLLHAKFRAARAYARERGWEFAVFTEERIRGPRLENLRFLRPYMERPKDAAIEEALLAAIRAGHATPNAALEAVHRDGRDRASALPCLWRLVASGAVAMDWNSKLGMATELRIGD